jgi:transcriptional antiterminator RfaH
MTAQWYALHSKPMKESLLWSQLCLYQVEGFYPCLHVRPANPRARKVKPYFPGYVFGRLDLERTPRHTILRLPGLAEIVSFDGIPSHVPDQVIAAIRRRLDEVNAPAGEVRENLKQGEPVTIQAGPFQGYEAILDVCLPGEDRVRVLLQLMSGTNVRLRLGWGQVRRKTQ